MSKKNKCHFGQHPICVSSDSNLPECQCWCAECKETMREWVKVVVMKGAK